MKIYRPFKTLTLAIGWVACASLLASMVVAQEKDHREVEVEIVDQDGKQLKGLIVPRTPKLGISIVSKDGKITIVDADGKKRVIDVQGAKRVTINQEVQSSNENGKKNTQIFGKAIIIGPDGERQEIVLGNPIEGGLKISNWQGVFQADRVDNKFMIGVYCQPVDEPLRAQLDLESGAGLTVVTVSADSAASKAGIQRHDILMSADDEQLSELSDLVATVQTAGKEDAEISFTVIRKGKEISVQVTPVERPAVSIGKVEGLPRMMHLFPEMNGRDFQYRFKKIEPGIVFEADFDEALQAEMYEKFEIQLKEMKKQMEMIREQSERLHHQLEKPTDDKREKGSDEKGDD